jgi:ADP-heptose:LPS heptosyltransferase
LIEKLAKPWRTGLTLMKAVGGHGWPHTVFASQSGLGDEIMLTSVVAAWKQYRPEDRMWVISRFPEIFSHHPGITHLLPPREPTYSLLSTLCKPIKTLEYQTNLPSEDRDIPSQEHFITAMMRASGFRGEGLLRPWIYLKREERELAEFARGAVVIQTTGRRPGGYMHNKEWGEERFAVMLHKLPGSIRTIQLGLATDRDIGADHDLRGKTTLRQSAAILGQADVFVGLAGGIMHMARAVDCPSVIIYGGREDPAISGYPCNMNLRGEVPCAPCWLRSRCDHERACMSKIAPDDVIQAVLRQRLADRTALATHTASI